MKKYRLAWSISLIVIACITVFFTVSNFGGVDFPDMLTRTLGILDLAAVVVLVFTSVKLKKWKRNKDDTDNAKG